MHFTLAFPRPGLHACIAVVIAGLATETVANSFLGLQITKEDFSNGWYDHTGHIITSPPIDGVTAIAWTGGELDGETYAAFGDAWDVYRLWVQVDSPLATVGAVGGSVDQNLDFILDAGGGGFFHTTTGLTEPVNLGLTFAVSPEFAFDSFGTIGSLTDSGAVATVDPDGETAEFEASCDARLVARNFGWFLAPQAGFGVVPDGAGGWRVNLGQFTVEKGNTFSGALRVSGDGSEIPYFQFSTATLGDVYLDLPHRSLGDAVISTDAAGNLNVSNIDGSGDDGVSIHLDEAGVEAAVNGFAACLAPIALDVPGSALSARCDFVDCLSTLYAPAELENTDGAVFANALFPDCSEVHLIFTNGDKIVSAFTVSGGLLFELLPQPDGLLPRISEIGCGFDGQPVINIAFDGPSMFRIVQTSETIGADGVHLHPAACSPDRILNGPDTPAQLHSLDILARNIDSLTIDCEQGVVHCPKDCAPVNLDGSRGNGTVNIDDLLEVVLQFGASGANRCDIAPINDNGCFGDGTVDIDDILEITGSLGPCD